MILVFLKQLVDIELKMKYIWYVRTYLIIQGMTKNIIFNDMKYLYSNLHSFNLIIGERLTDITDIQIPLDNIILGSVFFLQKRVVKK